jgi:hypothetical protein
VRRLREAALKDEDGCALTAAMKELALPPALASVQ